MVGAVLPVHSYAFFHCTGTTFIFIIIIKVGIRWIIETTGATIIRCIFLELNQSQSVWGIIMPIIRRTRTRLVKTSCEDACNIGRKNVGCIVADIVSCDHAKVMRLYVGATCGYCQYCDISILWSSDGGVCYEKSGNISARMIDASTKLGYYAS
jgi:hypothetical protein